MTYADKKRIADLDEFWAEANDEEPVSSVYLRVYEGGRLSLWIEGDKLSALKSVVQAERTLCEVESDGELH